MLKKLETPEFKNEQEEALWWDNNQELLLNEFAEAANEGALTHGTLSRRGHTPTTTIRLDPSDIALATQQAEERGLRYQTYLKMVLHQALVAEARKSATA